MGTTKHQRPHGWREALPLWVDALRAANRSEKTIRLYRHYVGLLQAGHRSPWAVGTGDLEAYLGRDGWGASARHSARSSVVSFYRWAWRHGHLEEDPTRRLDGVRVPKGQPRPTPEFVVRQMLRDHPDRIGFMTLLMAEMGLRCGEVAQVRAHDYVTTPGGLALGELLVHGKGGKQRLLPVASERLHARLAALNGWAFPNGKGGHLSAAHVSVLMSRALPGDWTAHKLRHRCGTVQYAHTRDLLAVSAFLGHANTEITQTYVALPRDALAAVARASAL